MSVDPRQTGEMPFFEHLAELRSVLMHTVIACLAGALAGWWVAPIVLEDLVHRTVGNAIVLSPLEAFNERFKLALMLGVVLTLPYVFYRVWRFVVPGLMKRERSMILPMAMGSMVMFVLGAAGAYFYLVPVVVRDCPRYCTKTTASKATRTQSARFLLTPDQLGIDGF